MSMSKEQLIELGKKQNKSTEQCKNEKSPERPVIKVCEENYYKICGSLDWKNKRTFSFQLDEIDKVPIIEYPGNVIRKDYVEGSDIIIAVKNLGFFTDKSLFKTLSRIYDDLVITELSLNNENKTMVKFKLANYKDTSIKETYESITAFDYTNPEQVFNFLYENSIKINEDIDYEICTTHLKDRSGSKLHVSFKEAMILYSGAIQLQKANSNNRVLISKEEALYLMKQAMKDRKQSPESPKGKVDWKNKTYLIVQEDAFRVMGIMKKVNTITGLSMGDLRISKNMLSKYSEHDNKVKITALSRIFIDLCICYMEMYNDLEVTITFKLKDSIGDDVLSFYRDLGLFDPSNPEEVYNYLYNEFIQCTGVEDIVVYHDDKTTKERMSLDLVAAMKTYSNLIAEAPNSSMKSINDFDNDSMQASSSFGNI